MPATIPQMIAAVNPDKYLKTSDDPRERKKELKEFKALIEEKGHLEAAEKAKPKAVASHKMVYETYADGLESVYFFLIDLMEDFGFGPEKLIDNFTASPGSAQFGEVGQRATLMQQHASRVMADIGTLVRGLLNLIYDLKEMKMRLKTYDDYKNPTTKAAAVLSLKQIWMDKVDAQKGNSSIKMLANTQIGFVTLIDAFLSVQTQEEVAKLDLNERVKRIVIERLSDFSNWVVESERELRKRFEVEKTYLRSQVNNLKIYSRWAKPYFLAASRLEQKERSRDTSLVSLFNRTVLQLSVMGKRGVDAQGLAKEGVFPQHMAKSKNAKRSRKYSEVVLLDFLFSSVPVQGRMTGKVTMNFYGYALNDEEIAKFEEIFAASDVNDVLKLVEGVTDETLMQIKEDLDEFLEDISPTPAEPETKSSGDTNPFLALFGFYNKKPEKLKSKAKSSSSGKEEVTVRKENSDEKTYIRPYVEEQISESLYLLFDIYKKANGMVSFK